jgi:catechol 2,3-dioxygenase-like lactoylglutathione lyase family enzyme
MPLLPISGIDHINMCVTNLEQSIAFYGDVFGFEIKEDHRDLKEYPWVTLGIPNAAYLILYETDEAKISRDMRIVHFGFALKPGQRIEDVLAKVIQAGIATKRDRDGKPLVAHYGKSSSIYLSDPDGYALDVSIKFGGGLDDE